MWSRDRLENYAKKMAALQFGAQRGAGFLEKQNRSPKLANSNIYIIERTYLVKFDYNCMSASSSTSTGSSPIPFFLSGIALNWFRGSKHLWRTFRQFARAFKIRFGDSDFQFELRQEIHQRTQGEKESVSDYLTCMRVMFDKLTPRMSEAEEISYTHRNLLPRLHLAISRDEIDNFTHLEHLANVAQKRYRVARSYKRGAWISPKLHLI